MTILVDSGQTLVQGGEAVFQNILTRDGATYNLTGKTVKGTIRLETNPLIALHSSLEAFSVTVPAGVAGAVTFILTSAMGSHLIQPDRIGSTNPHLLQYHVVEDDFRSEFLKFGVIIAF